MTIHDILERLRKVRKGPGGWVACCPAHEDKRPSLSVAYRDGTILLHCHTGCSYRDILGALGLTSLRETAQPRCRSVATSGSRQPPAARGGKPRSTPAPEPPIDWVELCADIQENMIGVELATLALDLGVSDISLARLECGWSYPENAYSFPMRNGLGEIVGVSLRGRTGTKWGITGSKLGLFIPRNLTTEGPLFMPEGASDTAALLDLGLNAVGRPQALIRGERLEQVRELMATPLLCGRELVIVADTDKSHDKGWEGGEQLARAMKRQVHSIKLLPIPLGHKDLRDWKRKGLHRQAVLAMARNLARVE